MLGEPLENTLSALHSVAISAYLRRQADPNLGEALPKTRAAALSRLPRVRYLPPALINDIFEGKVSMDTKPATQVSLFSDLSGFTKMSSAETVADFLNDYLSIMNETIFENNGTIDKFIGELTRCENAPNASGHGAG